MKTLWEERIGKTFDQHILEHQNNRRKNRRKFLAKFKKEHGIVYSTSVNRINPEKNRARQSLNKAVKRGKVQKMPCFKCGEKKVDAHHEDYSQRWNVVWACRKHHSEIHLLKAYSL